MAAVHTDHCAISFSLLFATPLLELHFTHVHDSGGDLVGVLFVFQREAQDVEGGLVVESTKKIKITFINGRQVSKQRDAVVVRSPVACAW